MRHRLCRINYNHISHSLVQTILLYTPIKCCFAVVGRIASSTVITMAFKLTCFLFFARFDQIVLVCACDLFCFCYSFNIVLSEWMLCAQLRYLWCCNVTFHNGTTAAARLLILQLNRFCFPSHTNALQFHPELIAVFLLMHHQSTKPLTIFERIKTKHFFVYVLRFSDAVHLMRQLNVINVPYYYHCIGLICGVVFFFQNASGKLPQKNLRSYSRWICFGLEWKKKQHISICWHRLFYKH